MGRPGIRRIQAEPVVGRRSSLRSCSSCRPTVAATASRAMRMWAISLVRPDRVRASAWRARCSSDGAQALVAVEGSSGESGSGGDGGEGDLFTGFEQVGAGLFDSPKGVIAHPVWACAMSVSRRATSLRCRSASAPQPRAAASAASASASTRWAASTPRWLTSVRKLGQCSQMLA